MKFVVVLVDGLADRPVAELDHRTPLEQAATPALDAMAAAGVVGRVDLTAGTRSFAPEGPLFSLLGGEAGRELPGRGGFEAFAVGQPAGGRGRVASARLVSRFEDRLADLSGGDLRDAEARLLLERLNAALGAPGFQLVHLRGNQALLLLGDAHGAVPETTPPELCLGRPLGEHLPRGPGGDRLAALIQASGEILENEPVNRVRCDLGENPANLLWVWGVADLPLGSRWLGEVRRKGALVTGEFWAAGMALAFGLDPVGEAGGVGADLEALGREAVAAVEALDFVVVHVGEPGACALAQDPRRKSESLEALDRFVVGPLKRRVGGSGRLAVVSAWIAASDEGRIRSGFNPFVMWGRDADAAVLDRRFTEAEAEASRLEVVGGAQFREYFFADR